MPIAIKKYKFYIREMEFCKFIIRLGEFSINPKKIKAVIN
jgi:hypothetical protein